MDKSKVLSAFTGASTTEAALKTLERIEISSMDLADPATIDAFAKKFLASGRPLHILVNSAGIMPPPLVRDDRGHESQFAIDPEAAERLWTLSERLTGAQTVA